MSHTVFARLSCRLLTRYRHNSVKCARGLRSFPLKDRLLTAKSSSLVIVVVAR
jgi:hypothetical protein